MKPSDILVGKTYITSQDTERSVMQIRNGMHKHTKLIVYVDYFESGRKRQMRLPMFARTVVQELPVE